MTSIYLHRLFWRDALERCVRAFATSSLALLLSDRVVGVLEIDAREWLSVAALAVLVSLLTSLAAGKVGDDSASFQ
jgi:hypothetical protein